MKKHIITIAGNNGSGKSTASNRVAQVLGYQKKSIGDFMRRIADDRGISLEKLSKNAETDPSIDKALDDANIEIGKLSNIVVDARLAFHFIPKSFKVFLYCPAEVAAVRFLEDKKINPNRLNESSDELKTPDEVANSFKKRLQSERKRYSDMYGINDHTDPNNFDLVIDTSKPENNKDKVPELIVEAYNVWLKNTFLYRLINFFKKLFFLN